MRYLIFFSYDGTNFNGFQKQPGKRTIEGAIEEVLFKINNNKNTKIYASGRTDSKVHALRQAGHFDLDINISNSKLKRALNTYLPKDIYVSEVKQVEDNFNARFHVKKKTYKYIINCGEYNPLERNFVYQYCRELDLVKIKESIKFLVGEHDFSAFVSNEDKRESYIREIYSVSIKREEDKVIFTFVGNGFMKYQVRYMVGTLLRVGSGKYEFNIIEKILKDKEYSKFVTIIKPEGLYLENVEY